MRGQHIPWSQDELAFIEAHRALPRARLHAAFVARFCRDDVSVDAIKALCTRKGWRRLEPWSAPDSAYVAAHFPHQRTREVAAALGRTSAAVHAEARRLGLSKTPQFLSSEASGRLRPGDPRGASTRFQPGQPSPWQGKRRPTTGRSHSTQFQKRQRPFNHVPIGTEVVKHGGYRWRKVADVPNVAWTQNWRQVHLIEWEAVHGPLPPRHALKCLDGDRLNCDPANWTAIPRAVLPLLSGHGAKVPFDQAPAPLKPALLTLARVKHAASTRRKERIAS